MKILQIRVHFRVKPQQDHNKYNGERGAEVKHDPRLRCYYKEQALGEKCHHVKFHSPLF